MVRDRDRVERWITDGKPSLCPRHPYQTLFLAFFLEKVPAFVLSQIQSDPRQLVNARARAAVQTLRAYSVRRSQRLLVKLLVEWHVWLAGVLYFAAPARRRNEAVTAEVAPAVKPSETPVVPVG